MRIVLGYSLGKAVGSSLDECYVLGFRFEAEWGFKPDQGDSWLVQIRQGRLRRVAGGAGWFTALWQAPSGAIYLASSAGSVLVGRQDVAGELDWVTHPLAFFVRGIWGLDDANVFAWGSTSERPFLAHWNGHEWNDWPVPGAEIMSMHGLASGELYAVGDKGLVARWDGSRWIRAQTQSTAALSSVFVAAANEIYACGSGRRLLQGSSYGWAERASASSALSDVAKVGASVWVASPAYGLMDLAADRLEVLAPTLKASRIVPTPGGGALVSTRLAVAYTRDGRDYTSIGVDVFAATFGDLPPQWTT